MSFPLITFSLARRSRSVPIARMEGDLNDKRLMSPHQLWNSALVLCLLRVSCFSEDTLSPQQVDSNLTNRTGPDIPDPNRGLQPIIPVLSVTWKEREWLL